MRTTLTLEPDVERLIKRSMRERRIGMKQAVNEAIRRGLDEAPAEVSFPTFHMGKPKIDLTKALQILGDMEDEEILRKMARDA